MAFILPGILIIGLVCIAIWAVFFRATLHQERIIREARQRNINFERLLVTPGEPLYCLACQEAFRGPMETEGCPHCKVQSFVIPVRTSNDPSISRKALRLSCPPIEKDEEVSNEEKPHNEVV